MESLQYKVLEFDLPDGDFDPNFIPENGIQYLQQVAFERNLCPAVVVKPLDSSQAVAPIPTPAWPGYKLDTATPKDLPHIHRPTDEWKAIQINEFIQMRSQIEQLRDQFSRRPANASLEPLPDIQDEEAWRDLCQSSRPLLSTMLRIDQCTMEQLLGYQLEWLADDEQEWDLASLSASGSWIYSSLGCLHLPLEPNMHSTLREIAKTAIQIRNKLPQDSGDSAAPLNLMVCIIAKNFDQIDLMEAI